MSSGKTVSIIVCLAGAAALLGLGGFLVAASGLYNVAASKPHFAVTYWLLDFAKRRSIDTQSAFISSPPLDDPELTQLGASYYYSGCAPCHGAPGAPPSPIVTRMLPSPADLVKEAPGWSDRHLFWIAKHGLKFTGMPGWTAAKRDDEIWAIVAFLRKLPELDATSYRRLALGVAEPLVARAGDATTPPEQMEALAKCARCHGDATTPPTNRLVPRLEGQSQAYLELSLRNYASGRRASGIMQPLAAALDEAGVVEFARYYARLPRAPDAGGHPADSPQRIARGKIIATEGDAQKGVPPCLACHAGRSAATFPTLDGQHARYIVGQLRLLKQGDRDSTGQGAIMTAVASRLSDEQMEDVAAYFASLAPPAPPSPAKRRRGGASP